jgi:hypothetical protein
MSVGFDGEATPTSEVDLAAWVEHPRLADYRKDVLRPMHLEKLVEYDREAGTVDLSPRGVRYVEEKLPLSLD